MTTDQTRLTRGQRYELDTALNDAQRLLVQSTPRSPEWLAALDTINWAVDWLESDSAWPPYTTPAEHARLNVKRMIALAWLRYWKVQS